jgi:uncharacterized protein YbjT (DUF2867 family)
LPDAWLNWEEPVILVTGAAGKTGRAVVRALVARGAAVRALVYRPTHVEPLRELGAHEVLVGDMRDRTTVEGAVQGLQSLYHICPNMSPDEYSIGRLVVGAARSAGVAHLVYHSVLHPQTEAMPHHWAKLRVEEHLFESGLPYTILQPAAYMQNVLTGWDSIVEDGVYRVPYKLETQLGMVDLEDVAAAAAIVLTEIGHQGATYELAGKESLTQADVATILGRGLGSMVRAEAVPLDEWEAQAREAGLGDYQVDTLVRMFRYYDSYGFWGNPNVLGWLLGRPPTTFETFVERTVRQKQALPNIRH